MLILSILFTLLSNAVTLRRDKSILFNRGVVIVLLDSFFVGIKNLYAIWDRGVGLYSGLF